MSEVAGKVAIVTGASRGIGVAVAEALAQAGALVMLTARDGRRAAERAEAIAAAGGRAVACACDVACYEAVEAMHDATRRQLGPVAILVNNAAVVAPIGPLAESAPDDWARNIQVNLLGAYHAVRAVLPGMLAAGGGTVVNLSSGAAHRPMEGWGAYCAGKAGLAMLTRALALECGAAGLRVFGLSPGTVDTDMQGEIRASGINRVSRLPRASLAPASDPARAVLYLCGRAADDLAGEEVSLHEPVFRRRVGLG